MIDKKEKQKGTVIVGVIIAVALLGIMIFFLIGLLFGIVYKYADGPCSGTKQFIAHIVLTGFSQTAFDTYCKNVAGAGGAGGGLVGAQDCVSTLTGKNWQCSDGKPATKATATSDEQQVTYFFDGGQYTFAKGSLAWRNNNPGNITHSNNAIGQNGRFAIFADYATGYQEIINLLTTGTGKGVRYSTMSIEDAISTYAPPNENNTANYIATIKSKTGLDIDRKIGDLTTAELAKVADAISFVEGYTTGTIISNDCDSTLATTKDTAVQLCKQASAAMSGYGDVPLLKQADPQWAGVSYGCGGTIQSSGCGITSAAMVLRYYGKDVLPPALALESMNNGGRCCNNGEGCGTNYSFFPYIANKYDLKGTTGALSAGSSVWSTILDHLKNKQPVIVSGKGPAPFTSLGHFIVLAGYDEPSQTVFVNDPNHLDQKTYTFFPLSEIKSHAYSYEIIEPKP